MTGDKQGPLERYLMVLEMVAASHDGLNMTDIANLTGLPKPTVHRLTRVLLEAGALETDGGRFKSFRIGPRLWRILYLGLGRDQVANMGSGRLRRTGRETARDLFHLPPWPEDHPLDRPPRARPGPSPARVTGAQLPAHAAASAKAILAFQPEEVLQRILGEDLPALTDRTKTDLDAVRAELEQVRPRRARHL